MNPYTGGYDLCLEVSEDVLSAFVAGAVGGQELYIPVQFGDVTGLVHLLIERAELAIDPGRRDAALVTVVFRDSSVTLAAAGSSGPVGPLGGRLVVGVPFSLGPVMQDPALGAVRGIQVDLTVPSGSRSDPVTVDIAPDPASLLLLDQLLAPTGLDFTAAAGLISTAVRTEIAQQFGVVPLGDLRIPVAIGGVGTLGVSLAGSPGQARFGRLDITTAGPGDDGRPGVVAVLAAIDAAVPGLDRRSKTRVVTAPGQRAGVMLSAEAFRRHVFCALLTEALDGTDFAVPPPCGTARDGVLRVARDRFVTGAIAFEFAAQTGGTGWSARAALSGTLTVDLINGELTPHVHREPAEVDLGIDDWLEALGAIFAAPLLIAAELALNAAEDAFRALIDQTVGAAIRAVAGQIRDTLNTAVLSAGLGTARLAGVAITPDGIIVQLQVTTPPPARLNPILGIRVDRQVVDLGPAGSGTVTGVTCDAGAAYHYEDHDWWTMITLTAIPQALGDQVSFEWTVNGVAVGPGTSAQLVPAHTYDGSQLPDPGRIQRILGAGGGSLTINHSPPEGNLNLFVRCVATNAGGREASRGEVLMIIDHQRTYEDRYAEDLGACIRHLVDDLGRGPVQWPPDPGDPVAWRDRLIDDHIGPLIHGEAVSGLGAVELGSLVGLLTADHAKGSWLQGLRPDLSGASAHRTAQISPR